METRATQEREVIKRARGEIEKRTGKTPEQLFEEREKRILDVIHLKVPDRMPVFLNSGFAIRYAGISPSAIFYDPAAYQGAMVKTLLDFEPDIWSQSPPGDVSGLTLDKLGSKKYLWPGGNLRPEQWPQALDTEVMRENEYDLFITDPSDFTMRYALPRAWKALEPLAKLPSFQSLGGTFEMAAKSGRFSSPEIIQTFETIFQAGQEQTKFERWCQRIGPELGCPTMRPPGGPCVQAFDYIADYLRGMTGIMVDMFRRPEKLLAAMERILEWHLARAVPPDPKERGRKRVTGAGGHWGGEGILSRKQFETFYWPTWKKSILAAIDMGFVPVMHREWNPSENDDRLECFLELPKGKAFINTEVVNVVRAKEI
ncbi:MAG: hypothetical protein HY665_07310, partial [Chloroflexi bacterium]|nr:hypothetical protein [Chloroflexota bacterium]